MLDLASCGEVFVDDLIIAGGSDRRSDGSGTAPGASPGSVAAGDCGDVVLTLDSYGEVCLGISYLRLQLGHWIPTVHEYGKALKETSPGVCLGDRKGEAVLTGPRPLCPPPGSPDAICDAVAQWKVTVDVR